MEDGLGEPWPAAPVDRARMSEPVNSTHSQRPPGRVLILPGWAFAVVETLLMSLREGQIKAIAELGRRGHAVARLPKKFKRFRFAVRTGVTVSGLLPAASALPTIAVYVVLQRYFVGGLTLGASKG